ncbi:MAG TPA: hypothetical protein VMI94_23980 [Bryobacteraceae bacterium]|nr:hypothetical protein [Bryobacteraceae bacterium]
MAAGVPTPPAAILLFPTIDFRLAFAALGTDPVVPDAAANTGTNIPAIPAVENPNPQPPPVAATDPQTTAFTIRLAPPAANTAPAAPVALAGVSIAGIQEAAESDQTDNRPGDGSNQQQNFLAIFEQNSHLEPAGEMATAPTAPAAPVQHQPEMPKAAQPLNHIVLQVGQTANERVLVRLMQQSGELRLAVRTDDATIEHGLQQGLADLIGKLQDSGYRAEAWKPAQSPVTTGPAAESQNAANHSRQGDAQSQPGWSQQNDGRRQQNHSNRPRWVEELECSLTGAGQA